MFKGIIPPVITPLNQDGSIDNQSFAEVIDYIIGGGAGGVIIGGTTGEAYALSIDERVNQFEFAVKHVNGRVPVICGVNDMQTQQSVDLAKAAKSCGADGLLLAAPPYSLPTEIELANHCLIIERAGGLPIMLYNYPSRTGVSMGRSFLEKVTKRKNFCVIKEASGEIDRLHLIAREFPQIALSCGAEDQALEFFVWGATSWVTPMGNFFINEVSKFFNTCVVENKFNEGRVIMSALLPLTTVIERGGKFAQAIKYLCSLQGLPSGPVRLPLRELKNEERYTLREAFETAKVTLNRVQNPGVKNNV